VAASPPGAGAPNPPSTPTPTPTPTPPAPAAPTATLTANPTTIQAGQSTTLTWQTQNATSVSIDGGVGTVAASGTQTVTPAQTTTYTLTATGASGTQPATSTATVTVNPRDISSIQHIIFMLQENRSFDAYFGQLGAYKAANNLGAASDVDGLPAGATNNADGGVTIASFHMRTGCTENVDPDWLESHGDYNLSDPGSNTFVGDGFVHNAQGNARTSGLVAEVGGGAGSVTVNPTKTSNYYLFQSQAGAENFSSVPVAVVSVTVTGGISPVPAAVSTPSGVTFTASATTVSPGQSVTLTWNVPGAGQTMVNTQFDQLGRRAMGYYDSTDLNYYYFLASNFATSDRWFSPVSSNSPPNRVFLYAATTHGHVHDPGTLDSTVVKNIFQLLDAAGITWKVYYTIDPNIPGVPHTALTRFQPFASQHSANLVPVSQYFDDLKNGTLAQVSFIEELPGYDEHPGATLPGTIHAGNHIQDGAQYVSTFINAFMQSKYWADGVFFLTYDEGGGFYDHVPPQAAVSPDGIPPQDLLPKDIQWIVPQGDFTRTGFRVPLLVISPFTKKSFVSHTPADFTAILKFIETRFTLPSLTARDAAQIDMTEFFDFATMPWATPPTPPLQNRNLGCDYTNLH
jgi:phospholipase C